MATTVSDLVAEIIAGGGFDVDSPTALTWLNRRHKEMVNHTREYRATVPTGPTVAGQQEYPVPAGMVELIDVTVGEAQAGGEPFAPSTHQTLIKANAGWLWLSGPGGLVIRSASTAAATTLALVPPPAQSGLFIVLYGCIEPPTLLIDDTVPLRVDDDLVEVLKAGVYATGLGQPSQGQADEAAAQSAIFTNGKEELRRRARKRLRGSGPARMLIAGLNA